eukprot:328092-Rhodomonas_salina.1
MEGGRIERRGNEHACEGREKRADEGSARGTGAACEGRGKRERKEGAGGWTCDGEGGADGHDARDPNALRPRPVRRRPRA